jgi:hypothetical protein
MGFPYRAQPSRKCENFKRKTEGFRKMDDGSMGEFEWSDITKESKNDY